jgi:hypothetical protein
MAELISGSGYTEADVQLVARASDAGEMRGQRHDPVKCLSCRAKAINVLEQLAAAGRLLPEDTREERSFAFPDGLIDGKNFTEEAARRYAADFGGKP